MKLYDGGKAPNPRRVRIFLAEKAIEVPLEPVDMAALGHRDPRIAAMNPLMRLPVLELDDGTAISETIAICRYFEALCPELPLFGTGAVGTAMVEMWQRRMEMHLLMPVANVFRHSHPAMKGWEVPQIAEFAEANRPKVNEAMTWLDGELADREWIAGDDFTVADITAFVACDFMKPARITMPAEHTNLRRWYEGCRARPSYGA